MTSKTTKCSRLVAGLVLTIVSCLTLQAAVPAGWQLGGRNPEAFEAGTEAQVLYNDQPSIYLRCKATVAGPEGVVAGLTQALPANRYAGKRVRFSAVTKSDGTLGLGAANLVFHVGRNEGKLTESTTGLPQGNSDWRNYEVVVDVPQDATSIYFGLVLFGRGTVWLNNVKIEIVGPDVPTTQPSLST